MRPKRWWKLKGNVKSSRAVETVLTLRFVCFTRLASHDHHTVDLHGTTVSEAIVIVEETLQRLHTSSRAKLIYFSFLISF